MQQDAAPRTASHPVQASPSPPKGLQAPPHSGQLPQAAPGPWSLSAGAHSPRMKLLPPHHARAPQNNGPRPGDTPHFSKYNPSAPAPSAAAAGRYLSRRPSSQRGPGAVALHHRPRPPSSRARHQLQVRPPLSFLPPWPPHAAASSRASPRQLTRNWQGQQPIRYKTRPLATNRPGGASSIQSFMDPIVPPLSN